MNDVNLNSKYRLLVLMDVSKTSEIVLENAIQLAKVIEGSVEVLYVKAPTDIVKHDNQFSAIRSIHKDYQSSKSRLIKVIRQTEKENKFPITYKIAYGNIKNSIKEHLSKTSPDIILLGKRKSNALIDFFRQGITNFVLEQSSANVLIVEEDHKFHTYTDVTLGMYGEILQEKGVEIINDLNQQNRNPIKLFKIRDQENSQKDTETGPSEQNTVSYVFSEGANAFDSLASYVSKTNTQLLCIPQRSTNNRLLQKLNVPVLILR